MHFLKRELFSMMLCKKKISTSFHCLGFVENDGKHGDYKKIC